MHIQVCTMLQCRGEDGCGQEMIPAAQLHSIVQGGGSYVRYEGQVGLDNSHSAWLSGKV